VQVGSSFEVSAYLWTANRNPYAEDYSASRTWYSGNTSIETVGSAGFVTGVAGGSTSVNAATIGTVCYSYSPNGYGGCNCNGYGSAGGSGTVTVLHWKTVMRAGLLLIVACFLAVGAGGYLRGHARSVDLLQKPISGLEVKSAVLTEAFGEILRAAEVPGGIAFVQGCEEERPRDFPPLGRTLREGLTTLTRVAPGYTWQTEDGVVNMAPNDGFPALLRTSLREFDSKDADNPTGVDSLLIALPEMQQAASVLNFQEAPNEVQLGFSMASKGGTPPPPRGAPLAIHCRACSSYQVLNAVVRATGSGMWIYEERHCSGVKTFRIAFSD
jgi:hypothetical protein